MVLLIGSTGFACASDDGSNPSAGGAGSAAVSGASSAAGAANGGSGGTGGAGAAAGSVVSVSGTGGSQPNGGISGSSGSAAGGRAGAAANGGAGPLGGESGMSGSAGASSTAGASGSAGMGGRSSTAGTGGTQPGGGRGPMGGTSNGGTPSGGTSNGGMPNAGAGGSGAPSAYPCDGTTSGYDAVVSKSGANWVAQRGGSNVYSGADMRAAIQAGIDSLSAGRTTKQKVLVQGSGTIAANTRLNIASYTVLNVCGTIDVTGSGSGDNAPIYARARTDIEIPNVKITGTPLYAVFFRDVENLHLGQVDIRVQSGLGIRIDNHGRSNRADKVSNIRIDSVYVEGTSTQGVETYGVDQLTIGTVIARGVGDSGLLLNDTTNAEIGLVDAEDTATGTGYAAFRMANRNGRINNAYPTNIRVRQVKARGGGRGIFCVSESGGAVIDRIDIAETGNNSILLENCYNVTIAAEQGSVTGGGDIRIAARTEFANSSDITIQNLTVTNSAITENPCADNSTFRNNMLVNSRNNVCN